MHILDTDTVTHLHAGNEKVGERLAKTDDSLIAISIVTKVEILRGRIDFLLKANDGVLLEKAQRFLLRSEELLAQIQIVYFDADALTNFEEFRQNSKFRKIGRNDLLIASICLANRAVSVTRNVKHFKQFPNLEVVNWVD